MRNGDFGEVCCGRKWYVDSTGRCSADAGQIWDPYRRFYDSGTGSAVRTTTISFIPLTTLHLHQSRQFEARVPANLQPPSGPGNLIDR